MRAFLVLTTFPMVALLSSYAAAQTRPAPTPALQAEIETVYTLPDGREIRNRGHLYRSRTGQVREDSPLGAVITDVPAGIVTILVAETKEARVIRIPADQLMRAVPSNPAAEVFEETTLAGHRVAKARTKGPHGQEVEFWTAKDLGVVTWTRTEAAGFTTTKELRNLSIEDPDPAVFAIPADYTIIEQQGTPANGPPIVPPRP
jgi:hypothetical protein